MVQDGYGLSMYDIQEDLTS